jgi:HAD superfamily hydrolase (TIGR01509 family)
MNGKSKTCGIDTVLFDFGGVLAEEGYAKGLHAIARRHGMNENDFYELARELIYATGYITGRSGEAVYWQAIRDRTGITGGDADLRNEILSRFVLRPFMFDIVSRLRASGIKAAILSDQTNWLDELDARLDFFRSFDAVYNSYHLGKSKADASHFSDIASRMKDNPGRVLFIDDDEAHCERARSAGLNAVRYTGRDEFLEEFARYCRF